MLKHNWQPLAGRKFLENFQLAANPLTSSDHVFLCGSERFNRESSDSSPISMVTIAGPIGTPSIAAVMSVFAKLAQTGFAGTGLLLDAFASRLNRQVIPKLDPRSMDIAFLDRLRRSLTAGSRALHS